MVIVLLSGGIDSCVTTAIAKKESDIALLHINYGQRTEKKELECFNKIADFYRVKKRLVCDLKYFKDIGGSSLTDHTKEIKSSDSNEIPDTYVPFRNANFLSIAVSWAEVIGANKIFIGAVAQDIPRYPDTQKKFYEIFNQLIKIGTKSKNIEVVSPVVEMKKSEVIKLGLELEAPLHLTWSCYKENEIACGECDSCIRRKEAFIKLGLKDFIKYRR